MGVRDPGAIAKQGIRTRPDQVRVGVDRKITTFFSQI